MERGNYYLHKDKQTGEILYLQFDKIDGYEITPKTEIEDAIRVNKIIMVNPSLSNKLIRKKVEIKIRMLLKKLTEIETDSESGDESFIQATLIEAERLKLAILNKYVKYLGNTYGSYSIKKIQMIINQLRMKLYNKINQRRLLEEMSGLYYLDEEEPKKGRGR